MVVYTFMGHVPCSWCCPPPAMLMGHVPVDDDEPSPRYPILEIADDQTSPVGYSILDDIDDDDDDYDDGDPALSTSMLAPRIEELPLLPMTPFRKACIDVSFVVGMFLVVSWLALMAIENEGGHWLLRLVMMLPVMALCIFIAVFVHFMATRDFTALDDGSSKGLPS